MNCPLSIRIPSWELEIIDRAAAVDRRTRTEFMRAASVNAAEEVLLKRERVLMSEEAFEHFSAVMESEPKPSAEMLHVFKRKAPWEET